MRNTDQRNDQGKYALQVKDDFLNITVIYSLEKAYLLLLLFNLILER